MTQDDAAGGADEAEHAADAGAAAEDPEADGGAGEGGAGSPLVIRRRGRRVTTEAPAGYTGEPATERQQSTENDDRLRGDLPPHWGKR